MENPKRKQNLKGPDWKNKDKTKDKNAKYMADDVFDKEDFPIPFENKILGTKWFDFNDASVKSIPLNRLQK